MKRLNVKRTYIFSYVAVILLALVMAGAALIGYGMNALKETMTYEQMEHARLAAADLKTQMDGFLQIRNRMKTNYLFQPAYQRRAYTRRLEMINALSGYDSYLLTDAQLYLMYGSDGEIYFDQTCTDWESLCRLYWGIEPDAFLHDLVCGDESVLLRSEALQGDLIEVLPFELGPVGTGSA